MRNTVKILFVVIAALIGAGFASGKEIYSFFFIYGISGVLGVFISSLIISVISYKVLKICYINNIENYKNFCNYIITNKFPNKDIKSVKRMGDFVNNIVNILLLITFFIMISGFSSFLFQEFNINRIIGGFIIIFFCYIAFQRNVNGLIKISNYLIPFFIIFLLFISSQNINFINNYKNIHNTFFHNTIIFAIIKAILYGSYNCILLIPVLVTLKKLVNKFNNIIITSISIFFAIFTLSLSVYNILLLGNSQIFSLEMPIIQIIKIYGDFIKIIYLFMIGTSIYTTAISTGCAFLNGCEKLNYKRNTILICIFGIILSNLSFSFLVEFLYPVLGIIGLIEVIGVWRN